MSSRGPPYFNQRAYSHWDKYTRYLEDMTAVVERCHNVLKDGAIVVWNVGNGFRHGARACSPSRSLA